MINYLVALLLFIGVDGPLDDKPGYSEPFPKTYPKYFYRVDDGKPIREVVDHKGNGGYFQMVSRSSSDTLKVYIQGVVVGKVEPNFKKARKADIVVWCFPNKYYHSKHLFSSSKGRIYISENRKTNLVSFVTHSFLDKNLPDNQVSKFRKVGHNGSKAR